MAELCEDRLAELGVVRDRLARAELAGDFVETVEAHLRLVELVDAEILGELLATAKASPERTRPLRLPVPYYGAKFGAAPLIEQAMGPIVNLVIPFGGSLGCLLGRSEPARVETANDKDGLIVNAWRAIRAEPFAVAEACAMPVHELTLDAVHGWLLDERAPLSERLRADPQAYDLRAAAYWLWGRSAWVGGGWCNPARRGKAKIALRGGGTGPGIGQGVLTAKMREELPSTLAALARRLRHVRMTCSDWSRVLRESVTTSHGVTGVYLDPCYALGTGRKAQLYGLDDPAQSTEVRAWALEHGEHPRLRIVLSGLGDEHDELLEHDWSVIAWRGRERLWLSPGCRSEDNGPLFSGVAA